MTLEHSGWRVTKTTNAKGAVVDDRKVIMLNNNGQPVNIQVQYVPYYINKGFRLVNRIVERDPRPGFPNRFIEFTELKVATDQGVATVKPTVELENIPDVIKTEAPKVSGQSRAELKEAKDRLKKLQKKQNKEQPAPAPEAPEPEAQADGKPKPRRKPAGAAS